MRTGIDARLTYYRPGGITRYIRHLLQELAALDAETDYRVVHNWRAREDITPGPNFQRANTLTPCHHRLEGWTLPVELLPQRLDVLHSTDMIPPRWGPWRCVITIYDLHFLHYSAFMTADSLRYYKGQIAHAVSAADHILVISESTGADLVDLLDVPASKITVHAMGVGEKFHPLTDDVVQAVRTRLGLPAEYILFVSTFEPRKNIPGLLAAYNLLRHEWPEVPPLVLAGRRGWLYDEIFATVTELDLQSRIIWLENPGDDALPAIYNGASVFVLPSHYEGFGLTAAEAMACGTPVVVANRSSLPEVVGKAGLLVDPDDPADIAAALQRLLTDSDLHTRLRAAGRTQVAQFTWRRTAQIALDVYRAVGAG
ncbi:MAG: glycosyltransferase family 4 protein [Chloroflexi bacterium]|nr:glycosyltransferase family 4 protein [Chloroflexota bacterium]